MAADDSQEVAAAILAYAHHAAQEMPTPENLLKTYVEFLSRMPDARTQATKLENDRRLASGPS